MFQIMNSLSNGLVSMREFPVPKQIPENSLLVKSHFSAVSPGTEKLLVEFGKGNLLSKARSQPDRVREVFNKALTNGLYETINSVKDKLNEEIPLGYCNCGEVIEVGSNIIDIKVGDIVATNGPHSEFYIVPRNFCVKIPQGCDPMHASFAPLISISLNGVRDIKPELGETFLVIGLGLVGLFTVQCLIANGCHVIAIDHVKSRLRIAADFGAEVIDLKKDKKPAETIKTLASHASGVDGVIICTGGNTDKKPMRLAQNVSRPGGRIILVGVTGISIERDIFYHKNLSFSVAQSYGLGRNDPEYGKKSMDYPIGVARWTAHRNIHSSLELIKNGKIQVAPLIDEIIDFKDSPSYYKKKLNTSNLGIVFKYSGDKILHKINKDINKSKFKIETNIHTNLKTTLGVGLIGAGNYARKYVAPNLAHTNLKLIGVSSRLGRDATTIAKKFGFKYSTSDMESLINDNSVKVIVIATQHSSHAKYVEKALSSGKDVLVEKPLCVSKQELKQIQDVYNRQSGRKSILCVGFNRRFSQLTQNAKQALLNVKSEINISININAGSLPQDSWVLEASQGGRLIGECCHFIDLAQYLVNSSVADVNVLGKSSRESFSVIIKYKNGSIASINYFTTGSPLYPKEQIIIHAGEGSIIIDNFRKITAKGLPLVNTNLWLRQDKGQRQLFREFAKSVSEELPSPIPINEIFDVARVCLELDEILK